MPYILLWRNCVRRRIVGSSVGFHSSIWDSEASGRCSTITIILLAAFCSSYVVIVPKLFYLVTSYDFLGPITSGSGTSATALPFRFLPELPSLGCAVDGGGI